MSTLMKDKNIVVMGVANNRSLAWGVAKSLHAAGANLIFTTRKERSYQKLLKLLDEENIKSLLNVHVKADYFFPKIAGLKFPRRTLLILLFFLLDPLFP